MGITYDIPPFLRVPRCPVKDDPTRIDAAGRVTMVRATWCRPNGRDNLDVVGNGATCGRCFTTTEQPNETFQIAGVTSLASGDYLA
jgi:hypothetical protein